MATLLPAWALLTFCLDPSAHADTPQSAQSAQPEAGPSSEKIVDADFEEVDDKTKKSN